jgi:hypothetical protein
MMMSRTRAKRENRKNQKQEKSLNCFVTQVNSRNILIHESQMNDNCSSPQLPPPSSADAIEINDHMCHISFK